jgi:hypothetical protein
VPQNVDDCALVELYNRPTGYFILPMERSTTGLWMLSGAVTVLSPDASDQDLAVATWTALALAAKVSAHPSQAQWSTWRREKHAPILRAAKVRSWTAFETGASKISVDRHGRDVTVTPCRVLDRPRGSREEMVKHRLDVQDPSRLPVPVRTALLLAETMTGPQK